MSKRSKWYFLKPETIPRGDSRPYLWRFNFIKTPWFAVMLHRFDGSDDECLHDHPWPFISVILRGGYWEHSGDGIRGSGKVWYPPGSILFRRADWAHAIEVEKPGKTWTLVLSGVRSRQWGFFTKVGWLEWFKYRHNEHC